VISFNWSVHQELSFSAPRMEAICDSVHYSPFSVIVVMIDQAICCILIVVVIIIIIIIPLFSVLFFCISFLKFQLKCCNSKI
jgi:hypothetical protein